MAQIISVSVEPFISTDLRRKEVVLASDTPVHAEETISGVLEARPLLREGEPFLISDAMIRRATDMNAVWGIRHAEALLRNPRCIPPEAEGYYIPFVGTILHRRAGRRCIACLDSAHHPPQWYLFIADLDAQFFGGGRLLRLVATP